MFLIAHGKVEQLGEGPYGDETVTGLLADGDTFGGQVLADPDGSWEFTARAATATTVLALPHSAYQAVAERHPELSAHVASVGSTSTARSTRSARRRSTSAPDTSANPTCRARSWTTTSPRASTNSASPRPC